MTSNHVRFWLALIIAVFFLSPGFIDPASMQAFADREMEQTRRVFGNKVADWLGQQASIVYQLGPADQFAKAGIGEDGVRRTRSVVPQTGEALVSAYNGYFKRLTINAYVSTLRVFILGIWLLLLSPVFIASVIDGLVQRAIKRAEFGSTRPAAFALTSLVVIPLLMAPFLYLVIPVSITPLITPVWTMFTAVPLALMVSNMQPVFGKT